MYILYLQNNNEVHVLCIPAQSIIMMSNGVHMNCVPSLPDVEVNAADLVNTADAVDDALTADAVDAADASDAAIAADKAAIAALADATDLADATGTSNAVFIPYIGIIYVGMVDVIFGERLNGVIINSMLVLIL